MKHRPSALIAAERFSSEQSCSLTFALIRCASVPTRTFTAQVIGGCCEVDTLLIDWLSNLYNSALTVHAFRSNPTARAFGSSPLKLRLVSVQAPNFVVAVLDLIQTWWTIIVLQRTYSRVDQGLSKGPYPHSQFLLSH